MDMTLLAQTVSLALPAAWLTLGVRDNILHPSVNETYTAQVFTMERMAADYPAEYARVAHRSITRRAPQRAAFYLVVFAELVTTLTLWAGVGLLGAALFGLVALDMAHPVAMLGALMFTTIWAMFTVVGNHFSYWFCHEGAQNTHFQLTLWGMANLIFLSL
jgi:predicted small integral membrane protein